MEYIQHWDKFLQGWHSSQHTQSSCPAGQPALTPYPSYSCTEVESKIPYQECIFSRKISHPPAMNFFSRYNGEIKLIVGGNNWIFGGKNSNKMKKTCLLNSTFPLVSSNSFKNHPPPPSPRFRLWLYHLQIKA